MGHKWEYKKIQEPSEERMNMLGSDGWELFSVHTIYYIFRRYVEDLDYIRLRTWSIAGFPTDGIMVYGGQIFRYLNDLPNEWVLAWVESEEPGINMLIPRPDDILSSTTHSSPEEILAEIRMKKVHKR